MPMVNSAEEATAGPGLPLAPVGARSFGPILAGMRNGSYAKEANDTVATIPMVETVQALQHLDDILSVPGVDAVYVGLADLSLSLGLPLGNNDDRSEFTEALEAIVAGCRRHGVVPGIHASGALAERRLEQGFLMVTVANDLLSMRTRMAEELAQARAADAAPEGTSDKVRLLICRPQTAGGVRAGKTAGSPLRRDLEEGGCRAVPGGGYSAETAEAHRGRPKAPHRLLGVT